MSRSPSPFSACWKEFSRVNAISTSLSCLSGFNHLLPSGDIITVAQESPTTARGEVEKRGRGLKESFLKERGGVKVQSTGCLGLGAGLWGRLLELKVL